MAERRRVGSEPALIPVADARAARAACEEVYANRPRWVTRRLNGKPPMHTLGRAAYLDLDPARPERHADYFADAGEQARWAGPAVRELTAGVRAALAEHLHAPVDVAAGLPAPGFHVFVGAAIPRTDCVARASDCASSHFDLQYRRIDWERRYAEVDLSETISFTLPLRLPAAGGGLTVWEALTLERMRDALAAGRFADLASAAHAVPGEDVRYAVGTLVVHGGHVLHQIAGVPRASVLDERITLQGHGVFADGAWRVYW